MIDENISKHIQTTKASFHAGLLAATLEGFSIPNMAFRSLKIPLKRISDGIELSIANNSADQQYWIMLTKYNYQPLNQTVQASKSKATIAHALYRHQLGKVKYTL